MKLAQLFSIYPQLKWGHQRSADVKFICRDSRLVQAGCVYVAVRGQAHDGHDFLPQVCRSGAVGIVVESESKVPADFPGAVVVVHDSRKALDQLASRYFGNPASSMFCVGVTGTNGKTSLTYLVESILDAYGWATGVMGTVDHHLANHVWESQLTTPDALDLQKRLAEFKSLGAKAVAFEVSSHALSQYRADAIPFDAVVFTNLTRDHLDYHGDIESYFAAKQRLFDEILWKSEKRDLFAIVNGDDSYGRRLIVADKATRWTYGEREADFCFRIKSQGFSGCQYEIRHPRGVTEINSPMIGRHNVYNCTAAFAVGHAAGVSSETCA
ncbi:MAG: UDP-N-acetylmuramoyl-L-alanyl-D-glutamate--2,6-diaminopimelate ligase, partial [Bdellovibrionales bacterium]|nr:UDP-N-acetylmuramoyl-L-alanyl-D-glutamate--2,6-diaminopimelate ligase [Bdellovibrionales bacterium]